jgi:transposase
MLTYGIVILHDKVRLHIDAHCRGLMEQFNWELFDRPRYSPDLVPSDYRLFTYLKDQFRSQHFKNNEESTESVKTWLDSQGAVFFHKGVQKLISPIQVPQFRQ